MGDALRPTRAQLDATWERLTEQLGSAKVRRDEETCERFSQDESDTGQFLPDLVVFAESTQDVSQVFQICQALRVPVTPVGARSGKSGGRAWQDGESPGRTSERERIRSSCR